MPEYLQPTKLSRIEKLLRMMTRAGERYEWEDCVESLLLDMLRAEREPCDGIPGGRPVGWKRQYREYAAFWGWSLGWVAKRLPQLTAEATDQMLFRDDRKVAAYYGHDEAQVRRHFELVGREPDEKIFAAQREQEMNKNHPSVNKNAPSNASKGEKQPDREQNVPGREREMKTYIPEPLDQQLELKTTPPTTEGSNPPRARGPNRSGKKEEENFESEDDLSKDDLSKHERRAAQSLAQHGVTWRNPRAPWDALRLARRYPSEAIERQIVHHDYLCSIGEAPRTGGWLVAAITRDMALPPALRARLPSIVRSKRTQKSLRRGRKRSRGNPPRGNPPGSGGAARSSPLVCVATTEVAPREVASREVADAAVESYQRREAASQRRKARIVLLEAKLAEERRQLRRYVGLLHQAAATDGALQPVSRGGLSPPRPCRFTPEYFEQRIRELDRGNPHNGEAKTPAR